MSATAASATEIVVDFHEKNGQPPPPPVNDTSEFKSSNTTNNLWLNFFGAADQVGYLKRNLIMIFNFLDKKLYIVFLNRYLYKNPKLPFFSIFHVMLLIK